MEERTPSNYIYALFSLRNKRIVTTVLERIVSDGISLQYDTAAKTDDDPSAKGSELLKGAKKAIVFISRAFSESPRCLAELSQLHDIEKSVVPIFLDCSSFPDYLSADAFWLLKSCASIYCRNFNTTNLLSDKNFYSTIYKYTMDLQGVPAQEQVSPRITPLKATASTAAQDGLAQTNPAVAQDSPALGEKCPPKPITTDNPTVTDDGSGEWQRMVEAQERLYSQCCKELGEEHPDTLAIMNNLAVTYSKLGDWQKTFELEKRLYPLRCRVLGEEHANTLTTMGNLAYIYGKFGDWQKVVELEEKLYFIYCQSRGEKSREAKEHRDRLVEAYEKLGMVEKAHELQSE